MSKQSRCELCFRLTAPSQLKDMSGDLLCPKCRKDTKATEAPRAMPHNALKARCEKCLKMCFRKYMTTLDNEHVCEVCAAKSSFCWFACAIVGNDDKTRKAIRTKFAAEGQLHRLGKIIIPKMKETRRTKARWRCLDENGEPIKLHDHYTGRETFADVSTNDPYDGEGAMAEAIKTFEGREVDVTETRRVRKTIDRKRQTIDQIHIVGKRRIHVADVQLISEGQKVLVQNRKAMPGYLLVSCDNDQNLLRLLKQVKGVYSVLPFTEKMDYEDYVKAEEEGDLPAPHIVSDHEVEKFATDPKQLPITLNYAVGDKVKIVSGVYAQSGEFYVKQILGTPSSPLIRIETKLLGQPIEINVPHTDVRKA